MLNLSPSSPATLIYNTPPSTFKYTIHNTHILYNMQTFHSDIYSLPQVNCPGYAAWQSGTNHKMGSRIINLLASKIVHPGGYPCVKLPLCKAIKGPPHFSNVHLKFNSPGEVPIQNIYSFYPNSIPRSYCYLDKHYMAK